MQGKSLLAGAGRGRDIAYKLMLLAAFLSGAVAMFGGAGLVPVYVVAALVPVALWTMDIGRSFRQDSEISEATKLIDGVRNAPLLIKVLIGFFIYALISCLWSINPPEALSLWARLLFLFVGSVAVWRVVRTLEEQHKQGLLWALLAGTLLAIAIAGVEIFTDGLLNRLAKSGHPEFVFELVRLNRASAYLSVIIWPLVAFFLAQKKPLWLAAVLMLTLLTIFSLESQTAVMALVVAGMVFVAIYITGVKGVNVVIVIAVLGVFSVPIIAKNIDPQTVFQKMPDMPGAAAEYRLEIWHYTANKAALKPWLGWGFNSSRNIPVKPDEYVSNGRHPIPLHPHNNVLQVWLELGCVGLLLWASFIAVLLQTVKHLPVSRANRAALVAAITAYFVAGLTGFGVWQNWWIVTGLLAVLFFDSRIKSTHG